MTNITEQHRCAFEALTSGTHENFTLFSRFVGETPAAVIVAVNPCPPAHEGAEPEYVVSPLFASVTPDMKLIDRDGREA